MDIATNFELWQEYVDRYATTSKGEFDNMSVEEKLKVIVDCFGEYDSGDDE